MNNNNPATNFKLRMELRERAIKQRRFVLDQIYSLDMQGLTPIQFREVSCDRNLLFVYLRDWDGAILNDDYIYGED